MNPLTILITYNNLFIVILHKINFQCYYNPLM